MALILGIETATEICSVALGVNGACLAEHNNSEGNAHAAQLHLMVEKLLKETGFTLNQLDAICISKGPGSYTGLRVGVSAAKGFAYTLGIPVITVGTLKSMVNRLLTQAKRENTLWVPMIDARRMEVYTAVYNSDLAELEPVQAKIIDNHSFENLLEKQSVFFFGNGAEKCKPLIQHPNAWFVDHFHCGAAGLLSLAEEKFEKKDFEKLAYFEPLYLKDFVGTTPKIKK